jgi:hypothetical protein
MASGHAIRLRIAALGLAGAAAWGPGSAAAAGITVSAAPVSLPDGTSHTLLSIVGTDSAEAMAVSPVANQAAVRVTITAGVAPSLTTGTGCRVVAGTASPTAECLLDILPARVSVDLRGGNDGLNLAAPPSLIASTAIAGGAGNDALVGGGGIDTITGGPGDDRLSGRGSNDVLIGDATGAAGGPRGHDVLQGGFQDDTLVGGGGSDILAGGSDRDRVLYLNDGEARAGGVTVTLDGLCNDGSAEDASPATGRSRSTDDPTVAPASCTDNGVDRDVVGTDVEEVQGSAGPDDIVGGTRDEQLVGGPGGDTLEGGGGIDRLFGGGGADLLLARDQQVDATLSCDGVATPTPPGEADRAVVDPEDPVEPDCETIERGGPGVTGPIGGGGEPLDGVAGTPASPVPFDPAPRQENVPATETGTGPGGGDDGLTPPQLAVTSPVATLDRAGRATLRVRCVYRAKACVGTMRLTLTTTVRRRVGGRAVTLRRGLVVGRQALSIPWGRSAPVRVRVAATLRALLRPGTPSVRVRAVVVARDGAAGPGAAAARVARVVRLGAPASRRRA